MNKKLIGWAEQVLFASAIFILVLVLFNDKIAIPTWLQPVGRMHPLVLHFPIVILLLAMVMEVFRFNTANFPNQSDGGSASDFYRTFLTNLLLIGTLSAGITVIMGLFLAKEDGYTGQLLQRHKWSGVLIFFAACFIYWSRTKTWYTASIARISALTTILFLFGAGHYGAALTHGDNFIFEPITSRTKAVPVALDQAVVFTDVIQPIFEQKCTSCHNPDKLKGELMLTDAESIQKGGKSGKLFVAGKPEISLLLQRIHLPSDEKKHMPPLGKTQLTPQEMNLLALWVKDNASFTKKVIELPATDSLRFIASSLFKPIEPAEEFDMEAADEATIQKLNNDYRRIAPLARESHALAVNLYNKSAYNSEKLAELIDIKRQIIYLNLNKLPVKDADLKQISQFENLQTLDLNFTDITGAGLSELASLKHLKSLAISGTKMTYADLQKQIGAFKRLETVSVWETELTPSDIQHLQKANKAILFIAGFDGNKSDPIRLNPPQVKGSPIFDQQLLVKIEHPIRGVQLRYTTDGTEPDSIKSPVLTNHMVITDNTSIKVKAYKLGWYGSNVATFDFYKSTYKPDSVNLLLPLNPVHQAAGAHTFFDGRLGTFNANSPAWANNWAGFRKNEMALMSEFAKPITVSSVALRTMIEPETGIFPPMVIEIWGGNSRNQLKLIATQRPAMPAEKSTPILTSIGCTFKPQSVSYLKIIAKPLDKLPDWHGNKGKQALLLVDEVFIN